jgi:predicted flap endonuclease-1-like 5' DNA nuclease
MGIGIVIQDRLNKSGIKTYTQLAEATPEDLEAILGSRITGARIDDWIAEARMLAKERASRAA